MCHVLPLLSILSDLTQFERTVALCSANTFNWFVASRGVSLHLSVSAVVNCVKSIVTDRQRPNG